MSAPEILTFGCRLNTHESEVMRDHARAAGMEDVMIINTCAVTSEAERQARQAIRRLGREQPGKKIIVTGCAAQVNAKQFADMPEVTRVIGNDLKLKAETWGAAQTDRVVVNDIFAARETAGHLVKGFVGHTRAFVQVQNDHLRTILNMQDSYNRMVFGLKNLTISTSPDSTDILEARLDMIFLNYLPYSKDFSYTDLAGKKK